ncbi:MAG TPA: ABC transporter [Verrucomicrobiales bacterium]|jgi:ABC-2 type transport system ATP-binding protein|nr:ABC transporter [Verrucomicrobiales bacterium]|tara:strand:+ start:51 stop:812 length:762 start_codon:yes stop_codon:yes gene_type:complete
MIDLRNLVKEFGDLRAVDDLSLKVDAGEFYVVLGPNAAGKTTTIKMLVGLISPTSGTLNVCGFDVEKEPMEVRRRLAFVPDFPFLYDKLTPWEFFRFTGQLFHLTEEQIQRQTRELIPRFSLNPYLDKRIESLSHGTRQRIAIVSALMHEPKLFVLDEPMVGLDPHHQFVLKEVLKERAAQGMTVFLSTHQLSVAEEVADRIGIVHMGKLVAEGTKEELHAMGGKGNVALEETFLALTREESDVAVARQLQQG